MQCFPPRLLVLSKREGNENTVNTLKLSAVAKRLWKDTEGQDLIEYALMAGFVAVAAGAVMPGVNTNISQIFSKISSSLGSAAAQGS